MAEYQIDFNINPDITGKSKYIDPSKDEIKEGKDYQPSKGENAYYVLTLTDTDGNEHELKTDSLPATIQDKDGNEYLVQVKKGDDSNGDEIEISEVVISESAAVDKTINFKINDRVYGNNGVFTTMKNSNPIHVYIQSADSIDYNDLSFSLKTNNAALVLNQDTIKPDSIVRYLRINSFTADNEVQIKNKSDNKSVSKLKIQVYDAPYVKFDLDNNYNGSYFFDKGFDEQPVLKSPAYYDVMQVGSDNSTTYYVPVLGIPAGETARIKMGLNDFSSKIANDTIFKVVIKSRMANIVSISGQNSGGINIINAQNDSIVLNQDQLKQLKYITIRSLDAINGTARTSTFIDVMMQSTRKPIGRLEYYSADARQKSVKLIYVKFSNESDYPNYVTGSRVQNYLNAQSHNQLFINYTIDDTTRISLNMKTSYFSGNRATSEAIMTVLYDSIIGNGRVQVPGQTYDYYFITNLDITRPDGKLGGAHYPGSKGGFSVRNFSNIGETSEEFIAHELGHWLNLPHTFESYADNPNIPVINPTDPRITGGRGATENAGDNFMDYNLRRKRWFKVQLINQRNF